MRTWLCLFALFCVSLPAQAAPACLQNIKMPFILAPLYETSMLDYMENLNRQDDLCPPQKAEPDCLKKISEPKIVDHAIMQSPNSEKQMGILAVTYAPSKGISAKYIDRLTGKATDFEPDRFLQDWGYGPLFHQTAVEQKDDWYRIVLPNHQLGWIKLADEYPDIQTIQEGDYLTINDDPVVIVKVHDKAIEVREEQPDEYCAGEEAQLRPFTPLMLELKDLYDSNCHLLLQYTYPKGC